MKKAVLYVVEEPKVKGESPKLYFAGGHIFSTLREDAQVFTDRNEMMKVQDEFNIDMQLEYLEEE